MGQADDLCGICYFLSTDECSWLTGQTIVIDGGTSFQ
jgi:7-alpha-hydroxysteroid dehydrogenase